MLPTYYRAEVAETETENAAVFKYAERAEQVCERGEECERGDGSEIYSESERERGWEGEQRENTAHLCQRIRCVNACVKTTFLNTHTTPSQSYFYMNLHRTLCAGIALHHLVKELASQPEAHEIEPDDESVRVAAEAERSLRAGLTDLLRGPTAQVRVMI